MKKLFINKLLVMIASLIFINTCYADNLGRLFTTAKERQKLEKIRLKKTPIKKVVIEEVKQIDEPVVEKEIVNRDAILLKGLVHRSGGKSTAWINETNTLEGDLDSQFIQVPDKNIKADNVTIVMPDDNTNVELRVGEVFIPEPIERDVVFSEDEM